MQERNQESLWAKVRNLELNLWKRDKGITKAIHDHRKNGLTAPHIEARNDVSHLQDSWQWLESLSDGGLKVEINGREFYVRFASDGTTEQLTPWANYFPAS